MEDLKKLFFDIGGESLAKYPEWKTVGQHKYQYVVIPQEIYCRTIEEVVKAVKLLKKKKEKFTIMKIWDRYYSLEDLLKHHELTLKPLKSNIGKHVMTDLDTGLMATTYNGEIVGINKDKYVVKQGFWDEYGEELYPSEVGFYNENQTDKPLSNEVRTEYLKVLNKHRNENDIDFARNVMKELNLKPKDIWIRSDNSIGQFYKDALKIRRKIYIYHNYFLVEGEQKL